MSILFVSVVGSLITLAGPAAWIGFYLIKNTISGFGDWFVPLVNIALQIN